MNTTIDATPTWRAVLPLLLAVVKDGSDEGRKDAIAELTRMASAADQYNALQREHKELTR